MLKMPPYEESFLQVSNSVLTRKLLNEYFNEIVLIDSNTERVINVSDKLSKHDVKNTPV